MSPVWPYCLLISEDVDNSICQNKQEQFLSQLSPAPNENQQTGSELSEAQEQLHVLCNI